MKFSIFIMILISTAEAFSSIGGSRQVVVKSLACHISENNIPVYELKTEEFGIYGLKNNYSNFEIEDVVAKSCQDLSAFHQQIQKYKRNVPVYYDGDNYDSFEYNEKHECIRYEREYLSISIADGFESLAISPRYIKLREINKKLIKAVDSSYCEPQPDNGY